MTERKQTILVDKQRASDIAIELAETIERVFGQEQRLPEVLAAFAIVFYSTSTPPDQVNQDEMESFIQEATKDWMEMMHTYRTPAAGLPC